MGALQNIVTAVFAISLLTFVALFGQLPALRRTPVGWLQRALCLHLPNALKRLDRQVTGERLTTRTKRAWRYLFYEKNPVVLVCTLEPVDSFRGLLTSFLIIFLALLTGSAMLFLWNAIPELPTYLILPIPLLVVLPYVFTWLCVASRGHHVTPTTHQARLRDYPYDHVLFRPNNVCSTCGLIKPARSKHCSLCGVCVAMCDHHCPWINNCVGRGNYRYFLALLLSLGIVEIYGAYLSWWILRPYLKTDPTHPTFSGSHFYDILDAAILAVNAGGLSIAGVGMLTAATGGLPLGLLAYHCYLIWAGMTTNESQKWADWRDDIADGCVFRASRDALRTHHRLRKHGDRSPHQHANGSGNPSLGALIADDEPYVPWPVSSDKVIVWTNNGRPPAGQEALWSQVWSLRDVDNIYDLGGWENFMELLRGR